MQRVFVIWWCCMLSKIIICQILYLLVLLLDFISQISYAQEFVDFPTLKKMIIVLNQHGLVRGSNLLSYHLTVKVVEQIALYAYRPLLLSNKQNREPYLKQKNTLFSRVENIRPLLRSLNAHTCSLLDIHAQGHQINEILFPFSVK